MSGFSVVIPTLNEERHLGPLLSDVAAQTMSPDQVLVVDAGSDDATVTVAGRFPFIALLEAEPPVALGRNAGGRRAATSCSSSTPTSGCPSGSSRAFS